MATIDTSIYANMLRPPRSVDDWQNALAQREQAKQSALMNALTLQQKQAEIADAQNAREEQNKLAALLSAPGFDRKAPDAAGRVYQVAPRQAPAILKSWGEQDKSEADIAAKKAEAMQKNIGLIKEFIGPVVAQPTIENAMAALQAWEQATGMTATRDRAMLAQARTPDDVRRWAVVVSIGAANGLPKFEYRNTGKQDVPIDMNSVTNPNPQPLTMTTTPGDDQQAAVSIANSKRSAAASIANAAATREVAQATRDAAKIQKGFDNETGLRKEFEGLPEVKNLKMAAPALRAVKDAASRDTTASDINIVYGLAKIYDPTSVVREGEYATVANSPNIPEKIKGYANYLAGGGRLTAKVKADLVREAEGRFKSYRAEYDGAKKSYEGIAAAQGMDPSRVFAPIGSDLAGPKPTGQGGNSKPSVSNW